jgi:hypothetical protein
VPSAILAKATANHIHEHGGEFVLPVKENRQALFGALDALPWGQVPIAHTATDKGHGRITTRTIQVLPPPDNLPFPHVSQVFLIERHVTDLAGKPVSAVAALGVASPEPGQADPVALAGWTYRERSTYADSRSPTAPGALPAVDMHPRYHISHSENRPAASRRDLNCGRAA